MTDDHTSGGKQKSSGSVLGILIPRRGCKAVKAQWLVGFPARAQPLSMKTSTSKGQIEPRNLCHSQNKYIGRIHLFLYFLIQHLKSVPPPKESFSKSYSRTPTDQEITSTADKLISCN